MCRLSLWEGARCCSPVGTATAGHELDKHLGQRQEIIDFLEKRPRRPRRVTMQAGPATLRAEMRWKDGGLSIQGVDAWNHGPIRDEYIRIMDSYAESGDVDPDHRMTMKFVRPDGYRVGLSMVRAAYLAAFCVFGWSYVFGEGMAELREHLASPDVRTVPLTIMYDEIADQSRRQFLLVDEPELLWCLAVTIGGFTVCLPSPGRWQTLEQLAEAFEPCRTPSADRKLSGKVVPWPTRPLYGRF